MNEERCVK